MNYYDDIRLEIYEAYDNGEISYNEKEYLLEEVNEVVYETKSEISVIDKGLFNQRTLRKTDVLNSKLNRGAITKDEYDKQLKEIKNNDKGKFFAKGGSSELFNSNKDMNRPDGVKNIFNAKKFTRDIGKTYLIDAKVDNVNFNEDALDTIKRYFSIMRTTDNFKEYKRYQLALCKLLQINPNSTINLQSLETNKVIIKVFKLSDEDKIELQEGDVLYHTSTVNNITRLKPIWKAKDNLYYPSPRIYFGLNKIIGRLGGLESGNYVYKVKFKPGKNVFKDKELVGSGAVYINSTTSIPCVKHVTESIDNTLSIDGGFRVGLGYGVIKNL